VLRRRSKLAVPSHNHAVVCATPDRLVVERSAWLKTLGGWTSTRELAVLRIDASDVDLGEAVLHALRPPVPVVSEGNLPSDLFAAIGVKSHVALVRKARMVSMEAGEHGIAVQPMDRHRSGGWTNQPSGAELRCGNDAEVVGQTVRQAIDRST
jgi:hypothetical protein